MEGGSLLRAVLVNRYEFIADRMLTELADQHGDRLLTKVRVADALDLDHMQDVPASVKSYGLSAHLDFLMVEVATSLPKFAVELDGRQHWSDSRVQRRDAMKDTLCQRAGLPLLRITSDFLRQAGKWNLLDYVVDVYYRAEGFLEAQENGYIRGDEPFYHGLFLDRDVDGSLIFDTLDAPVIRRLWDYHHTGRLMNPLPDIVVTKVPAIRAVQGHSFLAVAEDRFLFAKVRVRDFLFFGIAPSDLALELAFVGIGHLVDDWLNDPDAAVAMNATRLAREAEEVQRALDEGHLLVSAGGNGLKGGGPGTPTIRVR